METKRKTKSLSFKLPVFDLAGEKKGEVEFHPEVFGINPNIYVVSQAINVYLARERKAHPKAKSRGEVNGTGAKIWAQKGTGRARHGDRQAPIFVGGGVTHGPTGNENWKLKISKKLKRLALFSILSDRFHQQKIMVVDDIKQLPLKTKKTKEVLEKLIANNDSAKKSKKVCLLAADISADNLRGIRNLKKIEGEKKFAFLPVSRANVYRLALCDFYIFDTKAVDFFNSLAGKDNGAKK